MELQRLEISKMKTLTTLIPIFFISLLSSPSWGETLTMDDLFQKKGLFYKRFSIFSPLDYRDLFTGKISGIESGQFYEGKKIGSWEYYNENQQSVIQFPLHLLPSFSFLGDN